MLFSYKAKSNAGEVFAGVMEAKDRFALARELRSRGNTPISVKERTRSSKLFSAQIRLFKKISNGDLAIFSKNLSSMLKAGLSISGALSVVGKQTSQPFFKKVLSSLSTEIDTGGSLSSGFAKYPDVFSALFVSMTRAGEESGNLSGALAEISMNLEKSNALSKKVKGAMIYPGVILSAMLLIGILMFAFVVPTLASTFKELGVPLPPQTQMIIVVGNFFSNHLILTFFLLGLWVFGTVSLFKAKFMQKYIDYVVIRLPLVGPLVKELNTARTARSISSLLSSGVSITKAIEITEDVVQNVYYKKILREARISVEKGAPFSKVFTENPDLYPVMMSEMTEVGEEIGKISSMMLEVALFYEAEIENKTKNLSIMIEPALMVVIGVAVGFFAISLISPMYSVLENIN